MELLLLMLPVGYQTHARSKRVLGEIAQAAEDEAGDDADTHSSSSFPSLLDRLRLLAQQFVIDNRLIQQESLRRSNHDSKNSRKQPMDSTSTHGGHSDSDPSQSIRAKGASAHDDQNALARLLSNNVRPLLFVEMSPNSFDHIMCAADLAAFLRATNNKQWTVASSVCSGEPGIEQISFYRAAGGALLTPFESSALEPTAGTPWLPKSLQPPRRFVAAGLVGSSAMGSPATPSLPLPPGFAPVGAAPDFPLHGALRVLLRYAPLSSHARAAIVASHVNSQIQVAKMNRYAKSLQDAIGVENEATVAGLEMLWSRHGALISTAAAGGGTVSGSGQAIPVIEPSPERGSNDIPVQDKPPTDIVDLPMLSGKQQGTNATMVDENIVTFLPDTADFGPLVPGFSYLLPVTVQNNSSLTLLFEVFDPLPFDHFGAILPSFVSVKTHRFMISPYGTTLLNIVVALSPAGINTIRCKNGDDGSFRFDEVLRLTCHAVKRNFKLHVTGSANFASNANQALRTSVRVMEAAL
jgi:hypothetical protein